MSNGRFLISRDATGAFCWVLRDAAGEALCQCRAGHATAKACAADVQALRKTVARADLIDLTQPATAIKPKGIKPAGKAKAAGKAKVKSQPRANARAKGTR